MTYKTLCKLPLRTTLVVPFVLQIVTAVGLIGYLSFRNSQQLVDNLANQLNSEIGKRIEQRVLNYLEEPHHLIDATYSTIQSGNLEPQNFAAFRRYLWQIVHQQKLINYLYYGTEQGEFIGVEQIEDGTVQLKIRTEASAPNRETYLLNEQLQPQKLLKSSKYDPRSRPWYQAAKTNGKSTWSKIFASFSRQNNSLEISPVKPVYDSNGKLLGVLSINMRLVLISDFLKDLYISPNGQTFIIEKSGDLIASSKISQPFKIVDQGENKEIERLSAIKSNNAIVQGISQSLQSQFGEFNSINKIQNLKLSVNKQRYYIEVVPIQDGRGIDWLAVVIVPENDFMAQINANTRNTILLCLAALALAIALGIYTSHWITQPILRVSQASNELAQGNLNQQIASSPITEIDTLADSFNGMAGQLKNSFESLEAKNEELRIAEENYRSIFENALEGIFQSSPKGRFINVNPALAKIYGYDSPAEMIESITNISEQLYVDPEKRTEFRKLLETQGTAKNFEYRSYCKDSSIIWTEIDARAVKDSQGNVLYYEGIVKDISERKRREDELRRQLEELKIEIDQSKREQEVAMLTGSTYFQEVQQEMAEVNLDEFWN
ncbi:PAS domain S-box protein [Anabaena sp. WFMT]|uniref:PAS domain S-box protein n=1 Tax=Anabaena sp. WFMT TaxID=3449730 RepID=UPI003F20A71E